MVKIKPYRILSLNGGGARALFQAHYLKMISKKRIGKFWEDFDLVIGTSAGAIVAAAISSGIDPSDIIDLLTQKKNNPFPRALWVGIKTKFKATRGAGFENSPLKALLNDVFREDTVLGDCKKPQLAITATDLCDSSIRVFSPLTKSSDEQLRMVDVLMASTALPGVFKPYSINERRGRGSNMAREYVDGGLWANAPLLAAVSLAVEKKNCSLNDIRVVSIGTASRNYTSSAKEHMGFMVGSKAFYEHLLNLSLSAAEDTAHEAVARLIGDINVLHIDEYLDTEIKAWELKNAMDQLPGIAKATVGQRAITTKLNALVTK
ncbi:MAG: patatin-like phospholipase family protein [Candidatus Thiodiazotropha sp.]